MHPIEKPKPGEYPPYAEKYINLLPNDGQILNSLQKKLEAVCKLAQTIPANQWSIPCAEGEWTVKEVLGHLMDSERVFAYRALRFARCDPTELFPVDQDLYVKNSRVNERSIQDILEEYTSIRQASLTLFNSFSEEALQRTGKFNGLITSVRGLIWFTAGHELHHLDSIRQNYQQKGEAI